MTTTSTVGTSTNTSSTQERTATVRANGIDIHYVEIGSGPPLVLLHGGLVTTNPIWTPTPVAYQAHLASLAQHFRVIAPDQRGSGRTIHSEGAITMSLVADDAAALIEALGLDRPMVCGFSEGGLTATILAIRHPGSVRAVVNDAGYDSLNPQAGIFSRGRALLGGRLDATLADPDAAEANFGADPGMKAVFELMKTDQDSGQGPGHWRTYLSTTFDRWTTWPGYGFSDLQGIEVPALVLVGDRDDFCSVEEGCQTFRSLPLGELAVLPDTGHEITRGKVAVLTDFLSRHM
jgi:pimeloyl-ACP methyl ester carboxylesterase